MTSATNRALAGLLTARTGQALPDSRLWRLDTALVAVLRDHDLESLDALVDRLQAGDPALARQVVEALLNHETYFFRDRPMFDLLASRVLPELADRRAEQKRITVWSAGCSTGQEALTLAMLFAGPETRWAGWTIDILGTDVSESAVSAARSGRYSQFQIQRGLSVTEMIRWFDAVDDGWQARTPLLDMVRYEARNLFDAPSGTSFDLVLCRNVLLYFDAPNRERAFGRLAGALAPDGWLMLGSGETVIGQTDRLVPAPDVQGLYRRADPATFPRFSPGQRAAS